MRSRTLAVAAVAILVALIVGFAVVMFTYLGMHLLPTAEESAHVYTQQ